jgi:hypothetical protein
MSTALSSDSGGVQHARSSNRGRELVSRPVGSCRRSPRLWSGSGKRSGLPRQSGSTPYRGGDSRPTGIAAATASSRGRRIPHLHAQFREGDRKEFAAVLAPTVIADNCNAAVPTTRSGNGPAAAQDSFGQNQNLLFKNVSLTRRNRLKARRRSESRDSKTCRAEKSGR